MVCSFNSYAGWSTTMDAKVVKVTAHVDRYIIHTTITDANCNGKFYWLTTTETSKEMLSMAMMALASQMTVAVVYDENPTSCSWAGDFMTHISVAQ